MRNVNTASKVSYIWRAFGLQPHRHETFKLSADEKSQLQALDRMQSLLPLSFGVTERHSYDYVPHGTITLFAALLSERQTKRGPHRSTVELERAIRDYLAVYNQSPTLFVWHKTADRIGR